MSVASSAVSRAAFVLSGHAKLDPLGSDEDLVANTRARGHRIVSASKMGGFGNDGAWGIVRTIGQEELDALLGRHGMSDHRAQELLSDGLPLWHLVVEKMDGSKEILSNRLLLPGWQQLREDFCSYLVEPLDTGNMSSEDIHLGVREMELLLKMAYDSAKPDSKWKAQFAYAEAAPSIRLRKTLMNTLCSMPGDPKDLVQALLRYTPEALQDPQDPRRLQINAAGDTVSIFLGERRAWLHACAW